MKAPSELAKAEAVLAGILAERDPLEVERLVTEDARRLEVATGASRPLPADPVEELIADLRRIDVENPKNRRKP